MGFWSQYTQSLKARDIEEPIDVYVHRPLAYLLARAFMPLPISPNAVTVLSIMAGLGSGACLLWDHPHHLQYSGGLLFLSAVLDCADGQLARMRKTSSAFGRMLDGVADLITILAVGPLTAYVVWQKYSNPLWLGVAIMALAIPSMVTSSFHTAMYDHYKNVYLRLTSQQGEAEDYESALERYKAKRASGMGMIERGTFLVYLFYTKSQRDYLKGYDPYTSVRLGSFPPYDPARGEIYKKHMLPLMRIWRTAFGFGTLVFTVALLNAIERPEWFIPIRLLFFNLVFYGYLRSAQRKASRAAFEEMQLGLPDQEVLVSGG